MKNLRYIICALVVLSVTACEKETPEIDCVLPVANPMYFVDSELSSIRFTGARPDTERTGGFETFSGSAKLDENGAVASLTINVQTDTVFIESRMKDSGTMDQKLVQHLRSVDYLRVEDFSEASFQSTEIFPSPTALGTHHVTGTMTIAGTSQTLSFPAFIKSVENGIRADANFAFDRGSFGMNFIGMDDNPISFTVPMEISLFLADPQAQDSRIEF